MTIHLQTDAYTFAIEPAAPLHGWFNGNICFASRYANNFHYEEAFYCSFEDWQKLCDYIEKHIKELREKGDVDSPTWVTDDLILQVTCLTGDIVGQVDELDGGFDIRIMVKVGSNEEAKYGYIGLESWVEVNDALTFCKALREYVNSQQLAAVS